VETNSTIVAISRLVEYLRKTPYTDLAPGLRLSCAKPLIDNLRYVALINIEALLEREIREHNPNYIERMLETDKATNSLGLPIARLVLDDAVGLKLITAEERTSLVSMWDPQPTAETRGDKDVSQIIHKIALAAETMACVWGRYAAPAEETKAEEDSFIKKDDPSPDMDQVQIRAVLEHRFKGSLEGVIDGTCGQIFIFKSPPNNFPERIAVKTVDPARFRNSNSISAVERLAHEARHWVTYRHSPFIISPLFTELVNGWPYIAMPYCEVTLREYIDGKVERQGIKEALVLMIEVICGLEYASRRGLKAHQDLKPENVLLQNLAKRFPDLSDTYPFHWRARVADFGLANGYFELNRPWGSRPYMAPEQYTAHASDLDLSRVDVFACGVMLHELVTGRHPIGEVTSEVWPEPMAGKSRQWTRENKWKEWSRSNNKLLVEGSVDLEPVRDLVVTCLATEPCTRPSLDGFKQYALNALKEIDLNAYQTLLVLLVYYDCIAIEAETLDSGQSRYQQKYIDDLTR
jgi:serine/threonine protein kinase